MSYHQTLACRAPWIRDFSRRLEEFCAAENARAAQIAPDRPLDATFDVCNAEYIFARVSFNDYRDDRQEEGQSQPGRLWVYYALVWGYLMSERLLSDPLMRRIVQGARICQSALPVRIIAGECEADPDPEAYRFYPVALSTLETFPGDDLLALSGLTAPARGGTDA